MNSLLLRGALEVLAGFSLCLFGLPACAGDHPYDPCEDKACGDACSLCAPDDPDCVETMEVKVCGADGTCSGQASSCEGTGGTGGSPGTGGGTTL